jgi:hypothetical protein
MCEYSIYNAVKGRDIADVLDTPPELVFINVLAQGKRLVQN